MTPTEKAIPERSLGQIGNYAGATISLNMKKAAYWGISDDGEGHKKIWLSEQDYCQEVPDGLNEEEVAQIAKGLSDGRIVMGKQWLPAVQKDEAVLEKYIKLGRETRSLTDINHPNSTKQPWVDLVRFKHEGNYTAAEIIGAVLADERNGRNRQDFITFYQEALDAYEGPYQLVQDFPEDPDNYEVTVNTTTMTVENDSRGEDVKLEIPVGAVDERTPEQREKDLEEFLGEEV